MDNVDNVDTGHGTGCSLTRLHLFSVSDWAVVVFIVGEQLLFLNFQCMLIARLCYRQIADQLEIRWGVIADVITSLLV